MCGRYTLTNPDLEALARIVEANVSPALRERHQPRYNVAPTQAAAIVCEAPEGRQLELAVWGLPSPWGQDKRPGGFINARAETAATLPSFREAFAHGRCGVLADGFYEWSGPKEHRQPYWFHPPGGQLIVFAGLYRDHRDPQTGEVTRRFLILTTAPNPVVAPHHDRMPAIVPRGQLRRWLTPLPRSASAGDRAALAGLLGPAPAELLVATPVSGRVNSPRHDDPACLAPEPSLTG